jgi:hypothetical protein
MTHDPRATCSIDFPTRAGARENQLVMGSQGCLGSLGSAYLEARFESQRKACRIDAVSIEIATNRLAAAVPPSTTLRHVRSTGGAILTPGALFCQLNGHSDDDRDRIASTLRPKLCAERPAQRMEVRRAQGAVIG